MTRVKRETEQRGTPDFPFALYNFHISAAGRTTVPVHWHPEQEILYVRQGALEVLIDKQTFIIKENQICFVSPHALHSVVTHLPDTVYCAFVFSYDLLRLPDFHFFQTYMTEPLQAGKLAFPTVLDSGDPHFPAVSQALEQICLCNRTDPIYKFTVFHSLVSLYCSLHNTLVPTKVKEDAASNQAVKTCLDYMRNHYQQHITLEQLAQLVHLHPNYLCKLFRSYTGQTVFQQLTRIRLENAAELLSKEGLSVCQAANLCGFESVSFFSRKFKQIMGRSPREYKDGLF